MHNVDFPPASNRRPAEIKRSSVWSELEFMNALIDASNRERVSDLAA